jgi:hypothetical protein
MTTGLLGVPAQAISK